MYIFRRIKLPRRPREHPDHPLPPLRYTRRTSLSTRRGVGRGGDGAGGFREADFLRDMTNPPSRIVLGVDV